ncbi:YqjK family protein [Rhodoferax sp.]|uniref:YqjK family protein n=1 Tax=Rhodoferax sp. TaxID=50421 RepID=UPI0025DF6446|nr:YqjK family protein [Rhodoferax sp.]
MAKTRAELDQERARLTERIQAQRANLARELVPLQRITRAGNTLSALVDEAVAYVRERPLAMSALAAGLLLLKPKGVWRWAKRGFFIWRGWRAVQQWQPGTVMDVVRQVLAVKNYFARK